MKMTYEPVGFSEVGGVRYLHLGTEWIQGAMNLKHPNKIELEYAQQMMSWLLFLEPEGDFRTLQLGLGCGALSKFCSQLNKTIDVTAVELNPAVIVAARTMFALPEDSDRFKVIQDDALNFVKKPSHRNQYDVLQVDLYDGEGDGPALSSLEFYKGCYELLKETGVLTLNLFGRHPSFKTNIVNLCEAFGDRVLVFPEVHDFNIIAVAFKGPHIDIPWSMIKERANSVQKRWDIPAKKWVKQLKNANIGQNKKSLTI